MDIAGAAYSTDYPRMDRPPATYPLVFRQYILRNVQLSLEQVRRSGATLTDTVKTQALHILDFALRLDDGWSSLRDLLYSLSPYMARGGDRRQWVAYVERTLHLCQCGHDRAAEAQFTWTLGVLWRQLGDLAAAERYLLRSRTLATATGQARLCAQVLTELAHLAQLQHRLTDATAFVKQAHDLLPPDDSECAAGHSVLGDVYFEEQQWSHAAVAFERAIALWNMHGQRAFAASGWRGLARVRWGQGDCAVAIACYERAIALYEESDEAVQRAIACIGLGGLYAGQGTPQRALPWLAQAEAVLLPIQDHYHLAMLYTNYGIVHRMVGEWQAATVALHKSLAYYADLGDLARQVNVLTELATVYVQAGVETAARQTLTQAQSLLAALPDWPVATYYQTLIAQMEQALAHPDR